MEQNMQIVAKTVWKMIRMAYIMLRKGVSKGKLLADLNTVMNRGKIAGKAAIRSLMFHHHHHAAAAAVSPDRQFAYPIPLNEYEFSCSSSSSPASFSSFHFFPFHLNKRKHSRAESTAVEMLSSAVVASPALPGFRPRQLRITDSPFPLTDIVEEKSHVDEAAEEFIVRFYEELRRQSTVPCLDYS